MNFFGHATVATRISADPRFVLGAMLPDFMTMAQVRLGTVADTEVARGVAVHHETDRVFHALPSFRAACGSALVALEAEGVPRAAARAVGHVRSELLLDGLLSSDRGARRSYANALRVAVGERLERQLVLRDGDDPSSVRTLLMRLQHAPIPDGYSDPQFVCDRLHAILAHRPRLALRAADRAPVLRWLDRARDHLEQECDAILAQLEGVNVQDGVQAAE